MRSGAVVEFRPCGWRECHWQWLDGLPGVGLSEAAAIRAAVVEGTALAFDLVEVGAGALVGLCVLTFEHEPDGRRVVNVGALAARPVRGADIVALTHAAVMEIAREAGASLVRCWTVRPGLVRRLQERGARVRHVVEIEVR